ncbi:hypothetical protein G6F23_014201 [Rhizopus arrhizus]|nr:hypothetical protein G6F23_014201 [Rhizopus arrhizus]
MLLVSAPNDVQAAGLEETVTHYPAPQPSSRTLVIAGPTDTPVVAPLIQGFQSLRPDVSVTYREIGSRDLSGWPTTAMRKATRRPTPPSCLRGPSGATKSMVSRSNRP